MSIGILLDVPELGGLGASRAAVRLPDLVTVPLTRRVMEVVDHPSFQRLRRVRQLGATCFVYPGATHTRFEHSLGVYGTARLYLLSLLQDPAVADLFEPEDIRTVLMAALLHDLGHTPFAHTLEAAHGRFKELPRHEDLVTEILFGRHRPVGGGATLGSVLERGLNVDPHRVCDLIRKSRAKLRSPKERFLQSIISSALDADKMDYLWRDSVHLGVPYGRNYDRERLLNALTINPAGDELAITSKGRISAEVFLFCRYTMYSEVYWHHAVRSASAMIERAWDDAISRDLPDAEELKSRLLTVGDDDFLATLAGESPPLSGASRLLAGITGFRRRLYKRLAVWARPRLRPDEAARYEWLAALDRDQLRALERRLAEALSSLGRRIGPFDLLIDRPPGDKDSTPDIDVIQASPLGGARAATKLSETSAIVRGIGEDFLLNVKQIQCLVHPDHAQRLSATPAKVQELIEAVLQAGMEAS